MYITAVCVIFLINLRWTKNKSLYKTKMFKIWGRLTWNTNEELENFRVEVFQDALSIRHLTVVSFKHNTTRMNASHLFDYPITKL